MSRECKRSSTPRRKNNLLICLYRPPTSKVEDTLPTTLELATTADSQAISPETALPSPAQAMAEIQAEARATIAVKQVT